MGTIGVFVLSFYYIYLFVVYVEPVGGCSVMTRLDYTLSEAWGRFYKLHGEPSTWEQAESTCQMEGAVLATPYTLKATEILADIEKKNNISKGIYIGAKETLSKGEYSTIEGISLCRIPHTWAVNEPNSKVDSCVVLLPDGTLADEPCSTIMPFVCYMKKEECNCNNLCKTSDSAYKFSQRTGNCYKLHRTAQPWPEAVKICDDEGGHLVIINSQVEADVLKDIFAKNRPPTAIKDAIYIGLNKLIEGWRNIDGKNITASGYSSWFKGQPDNMNNKENCGTMYLDGSLNDIICSTKYPFICEIENPPAYV